MKLYVENREEKMFEAMYRHIACILMDRFKDTDDVSKRSLGMVRDCKIATIKVDDKDGMECLVESGDDYGMKWLKVTSADSAFQLETDLIEAHIWDTIWAWLVVPEVPVSAKILTKVVGCVGE